MNREELIRIRLCLNDFQSYKGNGIDGYRCFIGMLDISVRPLVRPDELTFSIPRCRLREMMLTIDKCCLSGAPAWLKVKSRINQEMHVLPELSSDVVEGLD